MDTTVQNDAGRDSNVVHSSLSLNAQGQSGARKCEGRRMTGLLLFSVVLGILVLGGLIIAANECAWEHKREWRRCSRPTCPLWYSQFQDTRIERPTKGVVHDMASGWCPDCEEKMLKPEPEEQRAGRKWNHGG